MGESLDIARKILEVIPPSMHQIRTEIRAVRGQDLTVPQFRVLAAIYRGIALASEIARHHGVSQAAVSKMVTVLCERGLVSREAIDSDRRQAPLELTKRGKDYFERTLDVAKSNLSERISHLTASERRALNRGLQSLEKLLLKEHDR